MKIIRVDPEPPGGSGSIIARVSIAMKDDCCLYGLRVVEKPDGRPLVYAPQAGGARVGPLTPKMTNDIVRALRRSLEKVKRP